MTAAEIAIDPRTLHAVYCEFISQARGEARLYENYTDELMKSDVANDTLTLDERSWTGQRRVITAVEKYRGLTPDQQFEKGIVSMLSRIECLFVSHKMRELFGLDLLSKIEHFDQNGEFQRSDRHDIIAPLRQSRLIKGLRFYTIAEMKKW